MPHDPQPRCGISQGKRLPLRRAAGSGALLHELPEPPEEMRVAEHRLKEMPVTRFQLLPRHVAGDEVAGGVEVAVVSTGQPPLFRQAVPQPRALRRLEHRNHRENQARFGDEALLSSEDIPVVRVKPYDHPSHDIDALRLHAPHRLREVGLHVLPFAGFDKAFPVDGFEADENGIDVCRLQQGEKLGVLRSLRGNLGDEPHRPPRRTVDRRKSRKQFLRVGDVSGEVVVRDPDGGDVPADQFPHLRFRRFNSLGADRTSIQRHHVAELAVVHASAGGLQDAAGVLAQVHKVPPRRRRSRQIRESPFLIKGCVASPLPLFQEARPGPLRLTHEDHVELPAAGFRVRLAERAARNRQHPLPAKGPGYFPHPRRIEGVARHADKVAGHGKIDLRDRLVHNAYAVPRRRQCRDGGKSQGRHESSFAEDLQGEPHIPYAFLCARKYENDIFHG
ncbi:MAG: hypothetical protein A4E73_01812 [Syntrophaceae bacterium PtaU1.Bin231]|nr:MAG: hypothetical protein A4E73_01812 [Syntrophaceae bacterium PtaU1.Bin231]